MSKFLNGTSIYTAVNSGFASSYQMLSNMYSDGLTLENLTSALSNNNVLQNGINSTFASYMASNFTNIDNDNDGILSANDVETYMNKIKTQGLTQDQISTLGATVGISKSLQETVLAHFDEIDKNKDGRVTNAEIQAYSINADIDKKRIEDINRNINRLSLFTEDIIEHEGSLLDYKYADINEDDE